MHTSNKCIPYFSKMLDLLHFLKVLPDRSMEKTRKTNFESRPVFEPPPGILKRYIFADKINVCRRYGNISGTVKNELLRLSDASCPGKGKSFCCLVYVSIISILHHIVKKGGLLL